MDIIVKECWDCPLRENDHENGDSYCNVDNKEIVCSGTQEFPISCPLKDGIITISIEKDKLQEINKV